MYRTLGPIHACRTIYSRLEKFGLIKAAFDFGSVAPLDGGGILEFGLQSCNMEPALSNRITPHTILRADYRDTWRKNA